MTVEGVVFLSSDSWQQGGWNFDRSSALSDSLIGQQRRNCSWK